MGNTIQLISDSIVKRAVILKRTAGLFVAALLLAGCSSPAITANEGSQHIDIRMDFGFNAKECEALGEVTGSEGHWYSYLFYPNDVLIQGAINDVKNQSLELNADTIFLVSPQDFATSFTVFGIAYRCIKP
ncbi:DUF4156 domain-containing protein [Vibrio genomosp. F10]|uniref:DUF4156 domain-containing protein n=1 Tax=Vibrio genomosp. F10 TaxID=723171 RepID=A0A1B9R2K1_9VIBR|nr:DUF4156 domain-containing protein [Vibrio genomosp. F10]OCH78500.1 hypothetical protein A6E14_17590 [Vibrio genomosp. F10]